MTTPAITTDEAFAALTQLITYSNKLARHTNADVALDTLRAEIDRLRAAIAAYLEGDADGLERLRAALEGEG